MDEFTLRYRLHRVAEKEKKIEAFADSRLSDWESAARDELKGADPWQKLSVTSNGLQYKPIYGPSLSNLEFYRLKPAASGFRGARAWFNCPRVIVSDPKKANDVALEHLEAGADGIFFELHGDTDFQRLLGKIEWPFCALHFASNSNNLDLEPLSKILSKVKGAAAGAWFGPSGGGFTHPTFRFNGFTIESTSPDAIGQSLAAWLSSKTPGNPDVAVSVVLGTDFFQDVAGLRALRMVWQRIHVEKKNTTPLYVHANSSAWKNSAYEPHGNMLKATSAAMAAILGGADALTVDPEDLTDPLQCRVARNVAILLREESRMAKVADPMAGCYFIDDLTQQIYEAVWNHVKAL